MAKYFLATILFLLGVVVIPGLVFAADVEFTEDTELDLSGLSTTLYAASSSECNSLTVSSSTLTVNVPSASTFTLKTASYTVLILSPSGGAVVLTFDTNYFGTEYVSQWTASSSVTSASVSFSVGVSETNADYLVKVGGSNLGYYESNSSGIVSFSYTDGFSSETFTITRQDRPSASVSVGGTISPGGVGDTSPPSISDITASVSSTGAVISWTTSESSLSWVVYGTSTDYGSEKKTVSYVTSHSQTITGLSPVTTYHYQIKAQDSSGNISSYTDKTFTTLALGEVPEVVEEEEEEVEEEVEIPTITFEKPISEMTIEEIETKIDEILEAIKTLQALLAQMKAEAIIEGVPADFTFDTNLQLGMSGTDVKYLQIVLNSAADTQLAASGAGAPGNETNYFGPLTKAAVIKFQEKYTEDTLTPWGLTSGTGFVGSTTRDKLNELLGK